jgi:hypothetical protein
MRQSTLALASLAVAAAGLAAAPVIAEENYPHGFIRNVEPGVSLQRATEVSAEEAAVNLPFLPGDRVWTDAAGRAEFQFPEGTVVRLDSRSKLDYSAHDEGRDERVVLRLWSGSLIVRTRAREAAVYEIETPGGLVAVAEPGVVRIDVEGGETLLSVYEGEASLDTGRDHVSVVRGERTWARWGDGPAQPEPFDVYATDDFSQWDADLESREAWAAGSQRYLPEELAPYAPEFEANGTWVYEEPIGYVWQPRVAVGWSPYSNGRWIWTYYGWTWVPYETWGWVPHHYGRWGFSVSLGWYWWPGRVWSSAWVSWGIGGGYVGWCPLGRHGRPIVPWPHRRGRAVPRGSIGPGGYRGHAVPRGGIGPDRAWTVVPRGDLGRGDIARRRVDPGVAAAMRVAESMNERPNRSAMALTASVPAAARAHPRPGGAARGSTGFGVQPRSSAGLGGASAVPRFGASARAPGRAAASELTGTSARERSRGRTAAAVSASPGAAARARPRRSDTATSGRSQSAPRSSGISGQPGSAPRSSGVSSRTRSTPRSSGVSSQPRSAPRSSGISSKSRSAPRSSGVSSQPRSAPRSSGVSSRTRSAPRSSGVSSQPRSAPRSSGASSRPRSAPRSSGVSSQPRSAPRSSGASSRPRSAPRSSGASSRPPSGGASRPAASARPRSGGRSAARARGGARRK